MYSGRLGSGELPKNMSMAIRKVSSLGILSSRKAILGQAESGPTEGPLPSKGELQPDPDVLLCSVIRSRSVDCLPFLWSYAICSIGTKDGPLAPMSDT